MFLVGQMSDDSSALTQSSVGRSAALRIYDRLALPLYVIEPAVLGVDVALLVCASVLAGIGYHWISFGEITDAPPYIAIGALAGLNVTTLLIALSAYKFQNLLDVRRQARDVTLIWVSVFLSLLAIAFTLKIGQALSRGATLGFFGLGLIFLLAWRGLLARLLANAVANGTFAKRKTMLIGDKTLLSASVVAAQLRNYGYAPGVIFNVDPEEETNGVSKTLDLAVNTAREESVESILLFFRWEHTHCIECILNALSVLPIPVYLVPDHNVVRYLSRSHNIGPIWTAEIKRAPLGVLEQLLKRTVDLIGASAGLLLLSPLMLTTALLIKLETSGPVFFTQWRRGFNGRLFRIFKFRSMTVLEDGPVIRQATRDDPRITRVGRWLRHTNIDELPQLLNVLRGEMSLVGPRPHAAAHDGEYERQIAAYAFRYQLKPGITGWAQFNGYRGETRTLDLMSKRIEHDLWYIQNWSLLLDLKILLGTVVHEVLHPRGY